MAQLFLYTDAAMLDPKTAAVMRKAGVIPVKVASLDAVRLVTAVPVPVESSRLLVDALKAINGHTCNEPARAFLRAIEAELRRALETTGGA